MKIRGLPIQFVYSVKCFRYMHPRFQNSKIKVKLRSQDCSHEYVLSDAFVIYFIIQKKYV